MNRAALEQLVCPTTHAPLSLEDARIEGDEVIAGTLAGGARRYPIEDGIPRFVADDVARDQTVRSFEQKWQRHDYYRRHTAAFYTAWYLERYGFGDEAGLRAFFAGERRVLDAGTGSGRDAEWFAALGAREVWAVDTAFAPLARARREIDHPIAFVQADIHALPLPDGFFDVISCDQVIHHTPDPRAAFEALARKLRSGGHLCCYVYKQKAAIREWVDDHVRAQIADLPFDEALAACAPISALGKALAELGAILEVPADIPQLGIHKGRYDLQRFIHYNVMKCFYHPDFDELTNNIVNADWYHPRHCHRFTPEAFEAWFDGWQVQHFDVREAGISCRAAKV